MIEFLTAAQIAPNLQHAPNVIVRMARRGDIPGHKIGGRWLFDPAEVEAAVKHDTDPLVQSRRSRSRRRVH